MIWTADCPNTDATMLPRHAAGDPERQFTRKSLRPWSKPAAVS